MNEVLTPGGAAVEMVVPPELHAAKGRNDKARETVKGLQKHSAVLGSARGEIDRALGDVKRERAACIEETAESELRRFSGEKGGDDIAKQAKRIMELAARAEVYSLTLTLADETALETNIALTLAQADLKISAAELIDAERFARLAEHQGAMDQLAASEGEVEIRSKRFEEEGRLGDQLRADARTLRETAGKLQTIYNTLRAARGQINFKAERKH